MTKVIWRAKPWIQFFLKCVFLWLTLVHLLMLADNPIAQTTSVYLICKGLWWIVDDDGLWQISAQDVEVLDVVSLDTDTMLTKQPVSTVTVGNKRKEKKKKKSISDKVSAINNSGKTTTLTPQQQHMPTLVLHTAFWALFIQACISFWVCCAIKTD